MTLRLYYTDSSLLEFDAVVVEADESRQRVYLDRTAFYPTSGGQPHDTGLLGGVRVVDVVDDGERIAHLVADALPVRPGDRVRGTVDAARRRDHMQQHTGQHLLSAAFVEELGVETLSVHFGVEVSMLELDAAEVDASALTAVEARANAIVGEARPVSVSFEDAATAHTLRKAPTRSGALRVVTIAGVDRSACGGTHVASTAAIGPVLIRGTDRARAHLRVEFLCGARALAAARRDYETLTAAAAVLSAARDDVPVLARRHADRLHALERERATLQQELAGFRAQALYADADLAGNGVRVVVERLATGTAESLRGTAASLAGMERVVYIGTVDAPPLVVYSTSGDTGLDAGQILRRELARVGGRGGGSERVAQGSAPDAERIARAAACLAAM